MKIFFDENFSPYLANGFSLFQQGYKVDSIEVLHIGESLGKGIADDEWIPRIAKMHGVAITQDQQIIHSQLFSLCVKHKIGIFFFKPPKRKSYTYWGWIDFVYKNWNEIKKCSKSTNRPFAYLIKPNSFNEIPMS